jgi:hypothetical protein
MALDGSECWALQRGHFTPGSNWIGTFVGPTEGLGALEKINVRYHFRESKTDTATVRKVDTVGRFIY